MKRIAIVQSSYIPWKGYFDLINMVDEFILYDDAQYTRRDWRNRNKIKTPKGSAWLTIPVTSRGQYLQKIKDTVISDPGWANDHWSTIELFYSKAKYFKEYRNTFADLYLNMREQSLSEVNRAFLEHCCAILGIKTKMSWSMEYELTGTKTEQLVAYCRQAGATEYLSGPSAKQYIEPGLFEEAGIKLIYMDYAGYRTYDQLFPPFDHAVSAIDLIFNTGPAARSYLHSGGA